MLQSTPKQRAANRANAQKSTGPRTTAGKAASRFNALKHGIYAVHQIMFDEKPEDLAELSAEYHELCNPADAKQRLLVDTLVHSEWRLRRMRRVEAELWQTAYNAFIVENIDRTSTCTSGDAFATGSATFESLQRVVNCCERVYHRALKELERLQATVEPAPSPAGSDPLPQKSEPATGSAPNPEPAPTQQPEQSKPGSANLASLFTTPEVPPPAPPLAGPAAPPSPAENPDEVFRSLPNSDGSNY